MGWLVGRLVWAGPFSRGLPDIGLMVPDGTMGRFLWPLVGRCYRPFVYGRPWLGEELNHTMLRLTRLVIK